MATEWLLTNGRGGFAMGTALGANTRRYHGLFIAAMTPPVDRVVVLHSIFVQLLLDGKAIDLHAQPYGDDLTLHPGVTNAAVEFDGASAGRVFWTWRRRDVTVRATLALATGVDRAVVSYRVRAPAGRCGLRLRPLAPLRGFHDLDHVAGGGPVVEGVGHRHVGLARGDRRAALRLIGAGRFRREEQWWRDLAYAEDLARGQSWREDVYSPGVFEIDDMDESRAVSIEVVAGPRTAGEAALGDESGAPPAIDVPGPTDGPDGLDGPAAPSVRTRLRRAADQFIVMRRRSGDWSASIIAGYPWFADWGRDAMISVPGLLLGAGRLDEAHSVLDTFARHRRDGLIPNCFLDDGHGAIHNTVDASLWFVHAVHGLRAADARRDLGDLVRACREIVAAYRRGTDFGIVLDGDDLLRAGDGTIPVTWMDARRDGVTFTARDGKPVEVNALWHHALRCLAELTDDSQERAALESAADRTAHALRRRFWWPERGCLHDVVVTRNGAWVGDERLRCNQIFAASLPTSPLTDEQRRGVVDAVRRHLLTPYGLRTLAPSDPGYRGRYEGDLFRRDAAYHNGTVWPWLLGPYCEAVMRVAPTAAHAAGEVARVLEPLAAELDRGCLNQIAEVYDGDAPHRASGCPAQAWSVAELLRVHDLLQIR